jgi:uncharacterized membrane protein
MVGYKPGFVYPFAVNGLLSVTQVLMIIYGHHLSNRFKVQIGFILASMLTISLPFASHLNEDPGNAFWTCFFILLGFGMVNGVI